MLPGRLSHSDHFMEVAKDERVYYSECKKDTFRLDLEKEHLIWSTVEFRLLKVTPHAMAQYNEMPKVLIFSPLTD